MITAKRIRMPPMVGVPPLTWCRLGPSSRILWPTPWLCNSRITSGASTKTSAKAVSAA